MKTLPMTESEIKTSYRDAKDKEMQIGILADMNACTKREICVILGIVSKKNEKGSTLGDLNALLFAQLERLTDDGLDASQLNVEISRSKAVTGLASQIVQNASLVLKAKVAVQNDINQSDQLPMMLEG